MVSQIDCMDIILTKFPGFHSTWKKYLEWWGGDFRGFCNDMSCFSRYTIELIKDSKSHDKELKEIFTFIEHLLHEGSKEVKDAAATCFLENLINISSSGRISALKFVHMLGQESKEYCIAWDEFTGVKTEGLYENNENK